MSKSLISVTVWAIFFALVVSGYLTYWHYWEALFIEILRIVGTVIFLLRIKRRIYDPVDHPETAKQLFVQVAMIVLELSIMGDVVAGSIIHQNGQIVFPMFHR